MERAKYILIALCVSLSVAVCGQANADVYKAYVQGNMGAWKTYIDAYKATSNEQKLSLVNYQYGYIGYCIDNDKDDEAEKYLKKAKALVVELEKQSYKSSMLNAYKSAFVGFEIGLSPYKAPFIGQESIDFAQKSVGQDAANYFAYVQMGNIAYYRPAAFGGSKSEGLKQYLKALALLEKNSALLKNNWNYLNLLGSIIMGYYELEQYENAKKYCIKALTIEPNFVWVKNELYPQVKKKL